MKPMIAKLFHHPAGWLAVALLSSLAARAPFMHYAVLDWDESTYILMADSLHRGNLPYLELTEVKPPVVFAVFAIAQEVFGKTIWGIRLMGILAVAFAAWSMALFTRRAFPGRAWPMASAVMLPWMATLVPRVGTVYAEHVAILFLCPVLVLLSRHRQSLVSGALMGLFMALAVLTRTNLAYPALMLGAASFFLPLLPGLRRSTFLGGFAFGAVFPIAGLLVLYRNDLDVLFQSVVLAPLAYSEGSGLFTQLWWMNLGKLIGMGLSPHDLASLLGSLVGLAVLLTGWKSPEHRRFPLLVLGLGAMATAGGIAAGGASLDHYAIQMVPFAVPLLAVALHWLWHWRRAAFCLLAGCLAVSWGTGWLQAVQAPFPGDRPPELARHDTVREMVDTLDRMGARGQVLFFLHGHIGYWLLDAIPPTRITHPSNLTKVSLSRALLHPEWTPESEIDSIFRQQPVFVIMPGPVWYLDHYPEVKDRIEGHLREAYDLVSQVGWYGIYARRGD